MKIGSWKNTDYTDTSLKTLLQITQITKRDGDLETGRQGEKGSFENRKLERWGGQRIRISGNQEIRENAKL
ncbi:hypothetical protein KAX97_01905 [candidate division WOR-3 bacterium]|nr:hypothetical protein [candidate division WOR-3 bacterium]